MINALLTDRARQEVAHINHHQDRLLASSIHQTAFSMWSRLTNVLRASTATKDESTLQIHGLSREEPSNLLQFQLPDETNGSTIPDTSNSPSIHNKKSMLKRLSKPSLKDDGDTPRPPSPFHLPATSKKPRGPDVRGKRLHSLLYRLAD